MKWKDRGKAPGTSCRPTTGQESQYRECTPWLWLRQAAKNEEPEAEKEDTEIYQLSKKYNNASSTQAFYVPIIGINKDEWQKQPSQLSIHKIIGGIQINTTCDLCRVHLWCKSSLQCGHFTGGDSTTEEKRRIQASRWDVYWVYSRYHFSKQISASPTRSQRDEDCQQGPVSVGLRSLC